MWLASYGVFTGKSGKKVLTGIKLLPTPTECTQPDQFDLKGMHKIPVKKRRRVLALFISDAICLYFRIF